jgi:single-stranded-DNA-specific exonuclease
VRWSLREADPEKIANLARQLPATGLAAAQSATLANLLISRKIANGEAAVQFLTPSLSQLHSPYRMSGMQAAVDRLDVALERKEPILIYGDYDVDGTTAIVILKTAIELCGGSASFHVPHRIREGYDMRDDVVERAAAEGIRLIVSVDMGIRAFAPAETARKHGVDLIVTDHHLPGPDGVPNALAVVNPNQNGCDYPCKSLCGAGVAFKLAQGLMERRLPGADHTRLLMSFMKVVAIATIADSVPLIDENRIFARLGLEGLRSAVNPGLKALLEVSQLGGKPLSSTEVAFRIAPRINAAGRMDVARDVVDLFSVKDVVRAQEIAAKLNQLNTDRQEEERRIVEAIMTRLEEDTALREAYCIVVDGDGWHRGVIGITATRVVERYGRPALVIARDGEQAHGSGRSISAFHLLEGLESCRDLFTRYGGHSHAVGFSMPSQNISELRSRMDAFARARLELKDFEPVLRVDAELPLPQVTPKFYEVVERMEPFGVGNPEPVFAARGVRLLAPPMVIKEKHVRLKVGATALVNGGATWRQTISYKAMGWRMAEQVQGQGLLAGDLLDIAFTLNHNDHPEFGGLELSLKDVKKSETSTDRGAI